MKYIYSKIFAFFLTISIYALPAISWAETSFNDLPIVINADNMLYDMDQGRVNFKGHVEVTRGDFLLTATEMDIFLENNSEEKDEMPPVEGIENSEIQRIEANGSVYFQYASQSGSAGRAVYKTADSLLTLMDDPEVRDGGNFIRGETIRYYITERRTEIVGGDTGRVEAIFVGR